MSPTSSTERRCVIVTGFPRSGTSWIAKCFSFAPGFTYYREVDNHEHVRGAEQRFIYLYLTAAQDDAAYRALMTRAVGGEVATAFTMKHDSGPLFKFLGRHGRAVGERLPFLFFRRRDVLLKLVHASMNLDWLQATFPHARQVCVVRHPCGQFHSWKRLGWEPRPERLLENPRLVADHLAPFADLIRSATGYWERAGALWAATMYVVHRQTRSDSNRIILFYERVCASPVARFQELYGRLGLAWTRKAERFILGSDAEGDQGTYSITRPTAQQIDKWKSALSPEEIESCRRFVEPFGLPYYPGFEPYVPDARPTAATA